MSAYTPTPIGVLVLDQTRRRQLAAMLGYIACNHHHIDPDRFDIDLAFLESVRERLEADTDVGETTLRLSARNLLALEARTHLTSARGELTASALLPADGSSARRLVR
jgi:hypothetical protein